MQANTLTNPVDQIEPFFFGPDNAQLFGCYHEPSAWPSRDHGVVICYPFGQEYIRSYRACHHLALQLARTGFPVLRFDYLGSGDSEGDDHNTTFSQAQIDLRCAIDELRTRSGVEHVILAGLRMGSSLALSVAAQISNMSGLVLWEPVVHGQQYLEELRVRHDETILRFFVQPKDYDPKARPSELLGFAISESQLHEIETLDLLQIKPPAGKPILLIESSGSTVFVALAAHLQQNTRVTTQHVPSFTVWAEDVDKGLVPQQIIEAISNWLEQGFA
jgi:uncharacterized protein